jgi:hypothetical protein
MAALLSSVRVAEKRAGYIIIFFWLFLGLVVPILHVKARAATSAT